jgi:hypothetical protein
MLLPCCKGQDVDAEFWRHERELVELAQQLKLGEYRLGLSDSAEWKDFDALKILLSENEVRLWNLQSEKSALLAEIKRLKTRNVDMERTALEQKRSRARGMKFETLSARDGRAFNKATITMVADSGVAFRHEHGAARLRYAELSDEQRLFFGMEEYAALAAEDRELTQEIACELSLNLEIETLRDRGSQARATLITRRNNDGMASRSLMAALNDQQEPRPLAQPARPFGGGSFHRSRSLYSGYRSYRPVYRYVYRSHSARNYFCSSSGQSSRFGSRTCKLIPAIQ